MNAGSPKGKEAKKNGAVHPFFLALMAKKDSLIRSLNSKYPDSKIAKIKTFFSIQEMAVWNSQVYKMSSCKVNGGAGI